MTQEITTKDAAPVEVQLTDDQRFAMRVGDSAKRQMKRVLGSERGEAAAHSITMAIMGAMATARDPRAFFDVTDLSIANCVSLSHETGLMPGGPKPVVYLIPRAPRRGERPNLSWEITHRGIARLAVDAGFSIQAVPVGVNDDVEIAFGEVVEHRTDPAAWPQSLDDLLGVSIVVRRLEDGATLCRPWMPKAAILLRRDVAQDLSVWKEWPIEQSQKTAIKWAHSRGLIPIASEKLDRALQAEADEAGYGRKRVDNEAPESIGTLPEAGRHEVYERTPAAPAAPPPETDEDRSIRARLAETVPTIRCGPIGELDEIVVGMVGKDSPRSAVELAVDSWLADVGYDLDRFATATEWEDEGLRKILVGKAKRAKWANRVVSATASTQ